MKRSIFKPIIAGILIGAALFMFGAFLLKALLFFLVIGAIFRFFIRRHFRSGLRERFSSFHGGLQQRMEIINLGDHKNSGRVDLQSKAHQNIINIDR